MKNKYTTAIIVALVVYSHCAMSQGVAINNTGSAADPNAMLDIQSTSKGMLIPRMTTTQRTTIAGPANGLLVFDNTTQSFWFYSGSWIELTDATTNWQASGSNIYYNTGNIGIGDATPAARLTVGNGDKFQVDATRGNLTFTDDSASVKFAATAGGNTPMMYMFSSGSLNADRMVLSHSPSFPKWGLEYHDSSDVFFFRSTSARQIAVELGTGDIGIGTLNPVFPIDLVGRMRIRSDGTTSNRPGIWFSNRGKYFRQGSARNVDSRFDPWNLESAPGHMGD